MGFDVVIVGAGLSGATLAERFATVQGKRVLVLEKNSSVGGACRDYVDADGILTSACGAHIFHTRDAEVWRYVSGFSPFRPYMHRVLSSVGDALVPMPVNITTVNTLFKTSIQTAEQMRAWREAHISRRDPVLNSRDSALSRVGPELYELLFRGYSTKQWDRDPAELDPSVLGRIPVRDDFEDRYFTDAFQGVPAHGYTHLFERMLDNPLITVCCNVDYFAVREAMDSPQMLIYTGRIDDFFDRGREERLEYRSLRFEMQTLERECFQEAAVVNYPSIEVPFTRIIEFKHMTGQRHVKTTIAREFPTWEGEPFYPVPTKRNHEMYARYEALCGSQKNTRFVGRLATYQYLNMDQAIRKALDLFERIRCEDSRRLYEHQDSFYSHSRLQ
jgi:UDP-galactopyranose mutase